MITLYELHWSHFCEKIRMSLNYMSLPWKIEGIDAFKKVQLRQHPLPPHLTRYTVPAIFDDQANQFVMDSTPILRYLASISASATIVSWRSSQSRGHRCTDY